MAFEGRFRDWAVYIRGEGAEKACYAVSKPVEWEPDRVSRTGVSVYVSTFLQDGVREEVSINFHFGAAPDAGFPPVILLDGEQYLFFVRDRRAFIEDKEREPELVAAMRRGRRMTVKARNRAGAEAEYVFSLYGVTAALRHVGKICE